MDEFDSFLLALEDAAEGDPPGLHRDCKRCNRPCSVCVCYSLPPARLDSKARLVVLQHPHEIRRRLATVPLLSAALEKVDVPRGRRFDGERCPPCLREAAREAEEKKIPVLLMFPGPGALDVKEVAEKGIPRWVAEGKESAEEEAGGGEREGGGDGEGGGAGEEEGTTTTGAESSPSPLAFGPVRGGEYVLVAVDGTWHQGKQMFRDLAPWFLAPRGPAIRVQLPIGDAAEELSEEAAAAVARAEEERRAAAAAKGDGTGDDDGTSTATATATPAEATAALADVTRNICADTRTIALFKEPFEGCMTTAEAIARALAELEPSPAPAAAVLSALNAVVDSQKRHDPAVRARCGLGEEEEGGEGEGGGKEGETEKRGGGPVESWHKKLHERRDRKRLARAARDAAAAGISVAEAQEAARRRRDEQKKRLRQNKNSGDGKMSASGLADGRRKFGFRNPPTNSCLECRAMPTPEERAAKKAEKLAARIEYRLRKQAEAKAADAAAAAGAAEAAAEG